MFEDKRGCISFSGRVTKIRGEVPVMATLQLNVCVQMAAQWCSSEIRYASFESWRWHGVFAQTPPSITQLCNFCRFPC